MKTLAGFATIRPGTWFFLPSLFTHDTQEEEVVSKRFPQTFDEVRDGFLFTATHLGSPWVFLKLHGTHLLGESTCDRPRWVNAIHCKTYNEPVWVDFHVPVSNVNAPDRKHGKKLRKTFFERIGAQVIPVNVVLVTTDVGYNPYSLGGIFDFFTDPSEP